MGGGGGDRRNRVIADITVIARDRGKQKQHLNADDADLRISNCRNWQIEGKIFETRRNGTHGGEIGGSYVIGTLGHRQIGNTAEGASPQRANTGLVGDPGGGAT